MRHYRGNGCARPQLDREQLFEEDLPHVAAHRYVDCTGGAAQPNVSRLVHADAAAVLEPEDHRPETAARQVSRELARESLAAREGLARAIRAAGLGARGYAPTLCENSVSGI